jgi:hypothetical protein
MWLWGMHQLTAGHSSARPLSRMMYSLCNNYLGPEHSFPLSFPNPKLLQLKIVAT